ncbi:MAG: hypothetical protein ACOYJJ_01900 [Anaerovoracaceae bacterium]|jgi:hypothetical protein
MSYPKLSLVVKTHDEEGVIVGAWMSPNDMAKIGVNIGDFIYASVGWTGSKSFRAVIKGTLPEGFKEGEIAVTNDRLYEGNMKEGEVAKVWKHDIWH